MGGAWKRMSRRQYTPRGRGQVARFFDGTDLVEPGLVSRHSARAVVSGGGGQVPAR